MIQQNQIFSEIRKWQKIKNIIVVKKNSRKKHNWSFKKYFNMTDDKCETNADYHR